MNSKKSAAIVAVACGFVSLSLALPSMAATCTDAKGHKYECTPKPILATPAKGQPAQGTQALINQNNARPASGIVAQGAGNIVAQGAGNIVAQGAGNAVAGRQNASNLVQKRGN